MMMTVQEKEYTKIMVEFMDIKEKEQDSMFCTSFKDVSTHMFFTPNTSFEAFLNVCKFHTSYDWLHELWINFRTSIPFSFEWNDHRLRIERYMMYGTIEEAFIALGQAIEWYYLIYNENKE